MTTLTNHLPKTVTPDAPPSRPCGPRAKRGDGFQGHPARRLGSSVRCRHGKNTIRARANRLSMLARALNVSMMCADQRR